MERILINTDRQECALCIGRSYQKNKDKIAKRLGGGKPGTHNNGDSALRGEFTWKGKSIEPWSGFIWNTSADFSRGALKDLSKTLKCDDAMCIMEVVKYGQSEADNSG